MNILSYVHLRNIYRSTGVGRFARELTENLAVLPNVRQEVLADRGDYAKIVPKVGEPWTSYKYHFFDNDTSRQQALWFLFDKPTAETYWPEADIVYCSAESYVPVRKARLSVCCHDAGHFEPGVHKMSSWLLKTRFKWKLLFRRLERTADMFHTISHFSAERMAHFFPAIKDRLRVVPNAASPSFFQPPTENGKRALRELGVADRPYVLAPGGLHHRKNAELILEAWPHLHRLHPDLILVITNHTSPIYREQARSLAPSLVLAGFQEEDQLVALYSAAQLVWFPTRYEGFGMPVIEAMACGTPVVSSNTTAIPEVAGGAAILISPDRMQDHIDAISELLQDTGARENLSLLGRRQASQFTWDNSARLLAKEFADLL